MEEFLPQESMLPIFEAHTMKRHNFTIYSLFILIGTVLFTLSSCKKDKKEDGGDSPESYDPAYDGMKIYMFGHTTKEGDALGSRPAYWYNGKINYLEGAENGGVVLSAYLKGTDLYAVGYEGRVGDDVSSRIPMYWLNGKKNVIEQNTFSAGNQIFVSDAKDVYVKRTWYQNGKVHSIDILKNGKLYDLEKKDGKKPIIEKVTGINNDVYVIQRSSISLVWKNGKIYTERKSPEVISDIGFNQQDTYLFTTIISNRGTDLPSLLVYKNNKVFQSIKLKSDREIGSISGVKFFVEGANTYIAASFRLDDQGEIVVWKNGKVHQEIKQNKIIDDLYVKNDRVFIGAYSPEAGNHFDTYWMDGKELPIDGGWNNEISVTKIVVEATN